MAARFSRHLLGQTLGCFLCLLASGLQAQTAPTPAALPPIPQQFAGEPLVIRQMYLTFSFNADGTGYREQTFSVSVQSEATLRAFSVLGIPFAGNSETVHFRYARVRHADGTVVETPVDASFEQAEQVTREAPLYSDLKQQQLPVKGLRVGDTLEWQVHVDRLKPEATGEFWGRQNLVTDAPVLAEEIELRVPANRSLTVWTNPQTKLQPATKIQGEQRAYRWITTSQTTTVGPEAEAARKAKEKKVLTPEEQIDAREGKLPDIAWTTFASWDAVGVWYRSLEADRTKPTPAIVAKVNELTAGKPTFEEKVRAVYNYVSQQVHYVGVDFGVGRYQPHPAADVLESQYGDCKDKHTLLASMLSVLGLSPEAVLIGSGVRFNPAVPSPDNFNHLITHVMIEKSDVWLDATTEVAPYRMLLANLRDKNALIVRNGAPSAVAHTPADPPFPTFEKMNAVGAIDKEGVSESHFTLESRGDEELLVRMVLRQVTPAQYDELTQRIVANLGFGGIVSHARFLHVDDTTQPLLMEWDYHREKAGGDWENLRTLPQIMMVLLPTVNDKEPPIQEIQLYGARDVVSASELKLPKGWSAELPEAVHSKSEFGIYDLTFRYADGTLFAERHWTILKHTVPQADWKQYKKWIDEVSPTNEPYVQLRQSSADAVPTPAKTNATAGAKADPASIQYIADAYKAIQQNHLDEGAALLDKARALNASQQNLWGDYGWLAWRRGNHVEAMRDYAKELDAYPDSTWAYTALSELQYNTGDHDGAVKTLRKYVAHSPQSPEAATQLIQVLLHAHKDVSAAAEADAALTRLPETAKTNTPLQLAVLKAELRGGNINVGVQTAVSLISNTTNLSVLNDAAYELAVSNQRLPLAEATERDVLEKLTAESLSWTGDEPQTLLLSKSQLLSAAWDTMGWILYREGKNAEAEPYVLARWLNRPTAEVGQHLGLVQLALGRKSEALLTFQTALATVSPYDAMGVRRREVSPEERDLQVRIRTLGGNETVDRRAALQAMRTIPLPSAAMPDGVAEYGLLLSPTAVKRAEPAAEQSLAGGAALLEKAKLPRGLFPASVDAQLVRVGTLNCHGGKCDLILLP